MDFSLSPDASGILSDLRKIGVSIEATTGPIGEAKRDAGAIYLEAMRARFGGSAGWDELSESTKAERRRQGYPEDAPILIQSGRLLETLTPGDPENILTPLPEGVDAGTSIPKSAPLHFGSPERKIPARPILVDPEPSTQAEMAQRIADGIDEAMK